MNRFSGMLKAFAGMLVLLALDQFSKIWVRETIPLFEMPPLVPNFLDLPHSLAGGRLPSCSRRNDILSDPLS